MQLNTTFSITADINPETKEAFGPKYAGVFSIRRPTLQDKTTIALLFSAGMAIAGGGGVNMITDEIMDANYVFAQLSVIKTGDLPEWFDKNKIYDEDEAAVDAVKEKVSNFLNSFRSKNDSKDGQSAGENTPVVVSPKI